MDCEVWRLKSSPFLKYKRNCDTRKRPVTFRDFRQTGPWWELWVYPRDDVTSCLNEFLQCKAGDVNDIFAVGPMPRPKGRNNSQQCKHMQCVMGRIRPILLIRLPFCFQHVLKCVAISMETICNARAWPQRCWKSRANGSNIVAPRFGE